MMRARTSVDCATSMLVGLLLCVGCNLDFVQSDLACPEDGCSPRDTQREDGAGDTAPGDLTDDDTRGEDTLAGDTRGADTRSPDTADTGTDSAADTTPPEDVPVMCETGTADCIPDDDTVCETSIWDDPAHCGGCDRPCGELESCQSGTCVDCPGADTCGACRSAQFCDSTDGDLVLCLEMESIAAMPGSTESFIPDSSSFGHDAQIRGGVELADGRGGKVGRLAGDPDQLTVELTQVLATYAGPVSWEAWIKPLHLPVSGTRMGIVDFNGGYGLFLYPGKIECVAGFGVGGSPANAAPPPVGVWSHIACVWDGTQLRLYVGGDEVTNVDNTERTTGDQSSPLSIGANSPSGDGFVGDIDDVRIHHRALTEEELCLSALEN